MEYTTWYCTMCWGFMTCLSLEEPWHDDPFGWYSSNTWWVTHATSALLGTSMSINGIRWSFKAILGRRSDWMRWYRIIQSESPTHASVNKQSRYQNMTVVLSTPFMIVSVTYTICEGPKLARCLKVSKCHVRWRPISYCSSTISPSTLTGASYQRMVSTSKGHF